MGNLSPVRLVFRQSGDDLLLAAEEAHDRSVGIVVSRDVQGLLEEMLPTSGPRFLAFWQSYEDSRGGGAVFFSELAELLGLIARHPELRVLPKLTAVRQAEQLFHDVIVAKVFTIAAEAGLRPALVPTAPPIRTADLEIDGDVLPTAIEVKAVTDATGIDLVDEGATLLPESAVRLCDRLMSAYADERIQAEDGLVVIGIWCDLVGTLANASPEWLARRIEITDLWRKSFRAVLVTRREGADDWYGIEDVDVNTAFVAMTDSLLEPRSVAISFTSGTVSGDRDGIYLRGPAMAFILISPQPVHGSYAV